MQKDEYKRRNNKKSITAHRLMQLFCLLDKFSQSLFREMHQQDEQPTICLSGTCSHTALRRSPCLQPLRHGVRAGQRLRGLARLILGLT
jgi:hypothetical protein